MVKLPPTPRRNTCGETWNFLSIFLFCFPTGQLKHLPLIVIYMLGEGMLILKTDCFTNQCYSLFVPAIDMHRSPKEIKSGWYQFVCAFGCVCFVCICVFVCVRECVSTCELLWTRPRRAASDSSHLSWPLSMPFAECVLYPLAPTTSLSNTDKALPSVPIRALCLTKQMT